uniref:Uncharacterized protein n=1 Tax=Arundo donax TaxID=35708 RepID=A0A0A8YZ44_ARUDO
MTNLLLFGQISLALKHCYIALFDLPLLISACPCAMWF